MTRLLQDLRYGLRSFGKSPAFAAVAILVMAVGIGANTAIFTIVNALLLQPLSGRADDLVGVYNYDRTVPDSYRGFSYPNYVDIRERAGIFDGLMAHTFAMVGVPEGDSTRRAFADVVSSNYFDTLGVTLAVGRTFTAEEERPGAGIPVVIASYPRWKKSNLDPAFVGSTIRINARDYTVVGVTPQGFTGTMALIAAEFYLPLGMFDEVVNDIFKNRGTGLADRSNYGLVLAGRLRPGISETAAASRLDVLARQLEAAYPAENRNRALIARPLPRMSTSTSPQTDEAIGTLSALLLGLSGVVLVIACLNVANMLLARGRSRRRELAVRLALGAARGRIVRQLLTESLALAIAGAGLGLLLSFWATRALTASLASALPLPVTFDPAPDGAILAATMAFAALSAIASGLGPAIRLSRRDLVSGLKDLGADDDGHLGRRFGVRNLMVIGQVALSLALLTAGGVFARTAMEAAAGNPGYSYDRLLMASVDASLAGFDETRGRTAYRALLDRIRRIPGVTAASLASTIPFGDMQDSARVERLGSAGADPLRARTKRIIGADYFATLGLEMVRGREFTRAEEESPDAPSIAIIDELLARGLFGDEDPIGQMIRLAPSAGEPRDEQTPPMQVIGIAPPLRQEMLDPGPVSHLYLPSGRHYSQTAHVHVRVAPGMNEEAALGELRRTIAATDADLPVLALATMEGIHDRSLELWGLRTGAQVFAGLGLLALLLAVVGLYGVKSYLVVQRTREIGIRMALGATNHRVVMLVLRQGLFLTGTGIAIGAPLAALVSIALSKVFVQVGGFDAVVLSVATIVLTASAVAASAIPAQKAARVDPLQALRTE